MQGFFKKEEVQSFVAVKGKTLSCFTCGLSRNINSPKLEEYGLFKKRILIVATAPNESEDQFGRRWKYNSFFKSALAELNVDLYEDCLTIGAINCRPPNGRVPKMHELNCCRAVKVMPAIKQYQPRLIILLGTEAVISIIGHRWKKDLGSIIKWRGWQIPDVDYDAWVCPTYRPQYVQKMHNNALTTIWKQDLRNAMLHLTMPFPLFGKVNIHYLTDLSPLIRIRSQMVAFDYETTGIKPHSKDQKIICASVATDENNVYVFQIPKKKKLTPFLKVLSNPKVCKIAQNLKFEDHWSFIKLGVKVKNWFWDPMLAAHILDNRPGITGLKFQAYVNLGIVDYDSSVSKYLRSKEKGGNSLNQIYKLIETKEGLAQILEYCALDSIYEYRISVLQMRKL